MSSAAQPTGREDEVRRRRRALVDALDARGIGAALVASEGNFSYLSGYGSPTWANSARPMGLVVTAAGDCAAIVSEGEAESVRRLGVDVDPIVYREPRAHDGAWPNYAHALVDLVCDRIDRTDRLAVELVPPSIGNLVPGVVHAIADRVGAVLTDVGAILWPLRLRKSDFELGRLRVASEALSRTYETFARTARPGMSERTLSGMLQAAAAPEAGTVGYSIVVAGAHQPPLGPATDRVWDPGELLLVDVGMVVDGYWADFSRHYAAGKATRAQTAAYARIVEAIQRGRATAVAGASASTLASAMGSLLPAGTSFGRLGHGIGSELSEPPSIHAVDDCTLEAGMTLCIEPSARFEDAGFLVGEEILAVTETGPELLSDPFPEELPTVSA